MKRLGVTLALLCACLHASLAQALPLTFKTLLTPEVLGSSGSGAVTVVADTLARTLAIDASWAGLTGPTTVAHIHCCTTLPGTGTVGVAVTPVTLPGFPGGVLSGNYSALIDLSEASNFTAAFISNFGGGTVDGAWDALLQGFFSGQAYFNVHTAFAPGGEIRGFLQEVPEPASLGLLALALLVLRRRAGRDSAR